VANAFFEIRTRSDAALRFHGGQKILFDAPFAFQLRRKIDNMQSAIPNLTRLDNVGTKIVSKGAGVAVNFQTITGSQRIDAAELEDAFGAIFELTKDCAQTGNDIFVALAHA